MNMNIYKKHTHPYMLIAVGHLSYDKVKKCYGHDHMVKTEENVAGGLCEWMCGLNPSGDIILHHLILGDDNVCSLHRRYAKDTPEQRTECKGKAGKSKETSTL